MRSSNQFFIILLLVSLLWATKSTALHTLTEPVTGMKFASVDGGTFEMGDLWSEGRQNEKPVHKVLLSSFHMSVHEVTVGQFKVFADDTGYVTEVERRGWALEIDPKMKQWIQKRGIDWRKPGFDQTDNSPVVWVTWNDAAHFAAWLSDRNDKLFRLPTEAEWEYAARSGGVKQRWSGTSELSKLENYAWIESNSAGRTHAVGTRKSNALGLFDMSGNVWEWVRDFNHNYIHNAQPVVDPAGPTNGDYRSLRGGSWRVAPKISTTSYRNGYKPGYSHSTIGFRLVMISKTSEI